MPKERDETPEQKAERKAAKKLSKRAAEGKPEAEAKEEKAAKKAEKRKAEAQSLDFFAPISGATLYPSCSCCILPPTGLLAVLKFIKRDEPWLQVV
jgi:hypothetical protein